MCDLCEVYSIFREHFNTQGDVVVIHRYKVTEETDENGKVGQVGYKVMLPRPDISSGDPSRVMTSILCIKVADSWEEAKSLVDIWAKDFAVKVASRKRTENTEDAKH